MLYRLILEYISNMHWFSYEKNRDDFFSFDMIVIKTLDFSVIDTLTYFYKLQSFRSNMKLIFNRDLITLKVYHLIQIKYLVGDGIIINKCQIFMLKLENWIRNMWV